MAVANLASHQDICNLGEKNLRKARARSFLFARSCVDCVRGHWIGGRDLATASKIVSLGQPAQNADIADPAACAAASVLRLRILATSDLHANILAWDYHANKACPSRGLARTATLIAAARAEQPNCLLFDNGDFLNGSALGDHIAHTGQDAAHIARLHPMIAAMNHLRYDAATLGNHEFSHGLNALTRSLRDVAFPVVASNLRLTSPDAAQISVRSLLLTRDLIDDAGQVQRLRIAVVGFLPPQTTVWEHRHLDGRAEVDDILQTAQDLIPHLRAAGADLVIALSHSGIGGDQYDPFAENVSLALAAVAGLDVIVAGHTHTVFPTPDGDDLAGKPAVMPGFFGSHLGVIDLVLQKAEGVAGGWQVREFQAQTRPIAARDATSGHPVALVADDPALVALVAQDHANLQAWSEHPIGTTPIALHSFFALLTASPALDLIALAQTRALTQGLANTAQSGLAMLSAAAPFKAGGRGGAENYTAIAAGRLVRRNASDLYVHPNSLVGLCLPGHAVLRWLERSVSLFHQITPGAQDADLINPDFPSYDFDVIYGLTYRVDVTQPARFDRRGTEVAPWACRIVDACFGGAPIALDQSFVLATNSYRCAGGSGFAEMRPDQVNFKSPQSNQSLVEAFVQSGGHVPESTPPHWGFVPHPGTTVLFDCDPRGVAALPDVPHLRLDPLHRRPHGFHRFRLHL